MPDPSLVKEARAGDRHALARLISQVEDGGEEAHALLATLYPHTGRAHVVGVTGAPGSGKSTLVNQMARRLRAAAETVAVVAVDPSSPFTGGALLGDRVRMRDLAGDPGVFIRSMASRGSLGGLARATRDVIKVLDAAGFDVVLVETVGAGQAEVDVARTAHTTVVVEAPGMGDEVQALKAGLLEAADVLVVNKADRPGAAQTARMLELAVDRDRPTGWRPPIVPTVALEGSGVEDVMEAVRAHRRFLQATGAGAEQARARARGELLDVLSRTLLRARLTEVGEERLEAVVSRVVSRELDVYTAVRELLTA
jgi:LAO/AO transport system kinase